MKEIYLVRHGKTDAAGNLYYGSHDYPLCEEGKTQVRDLAVCLEGTTIHTIHTSPMKRAMESAMILGASLGMEPVVQPLVRERSFGVFENKTYGEILRDYPRELALWEKDWFGYRMPEGESAWDCHERVRAYLEAVGNLPGNLLVMSHLGCIRSLLVEMLHFQEKDMWRFRLGHGRMAKITVNDEGYAYLEI
ncbi:MAG: histidine phosphatase family protein [Clostridia bacterium]